MWLVDVLGRVWMWWMCREGCDVVSGCVGKGVMWLMCWKGVMWWMC